MTREEAINEIRSWDFLNRKEIEAVQTLIPELRESEDERIRKALIDALKVSETIGELKFRLPYPTREECIAYLEKQKESLHIQETCKENTDSFTSEDEKIRKEIIDFLETIPASELKRIPRPISEWFSYLEKQKEQKPAEWSEDYREEDIQTRFAFYTYKDDPSILYLSNVFVEEASRNHGFGTRILKAAEKVAEAIGAITICLKVKQDSPANAWYRKRGYGYVAFEDGYDWLEKNLEYLKPKKEVEWSEENSTILDWAVKVVEEAGLPSLAASLKFLRPRWKPSEEQMNCLCAAVDAAIRKHNESVSGYEPARVLKSLYEDLQKL